MADREGLPVKLGEAEGLGDLTADADVEGKGVPEKVVRRLREDWPEAEPQGEGEGVTVRELECDGERVEVPVSETEGLRWAEADVGLSVLE